MENELNNKKSDEKELEKTVKELVDYFDEIYSKAVIPSLDDWKYDYVSVGHFVNEEPVYFNPDILESHQRYFFRIYKLLKRFNDDFIKECISVEKYNDLMHKYDVLSLASDSDFSDRYHERIDNYFDKVPRIHLCEIEPDKYSDDIKNDIKNKREIIEKFLYDNEQRIIHNLYFSHLNIYTMGRKQSVLAGDDRSDYYSYRKIFTPDDVKDGKLMFDLVYRYNNCRYSYQIRDNIHAVDIYEGPYSLNYVTTYDDDYHRNDVITSELSINKLVNSGTTSKLVTFSKLVTLMHIATTDNSFEITSRVNDLEQSIKYKKNEELIYSVDGNELFIKDGSIIVNDETIVSYLSNEAISSLVNNIICKDFIQDEINNLIDLNLDYVKDMSFFLGRTDVFRNIRKIESKEDILTDEIIRRLESKKLEKEQEDNKKEK